MDIFFFYYYCKKTSPSHLKKERKKEQRKTYGRVLKILCNLVDGIKNLQQNLTPQTLYKMNLEQDVEKHSYKGTI